MYQPTVNQTFDQYLFILYSQVGLNLRVSQDRVKFAHPIFHLWGRVMLNKL